MDQLTHNELGRMLTSLESKVTAIGDDVVGTRLELREITVRLDSMQEDTAQLDEVVMVGRHGMEPLSQQVPRVASDLASFVEEWRRDARERQRTAAQMRAAVWPALIASATALIVAVVNWVQP